MATSNDTELGKKIWLKVQSYLLDDPGLQCVEAILQAIDLSDEMAGWVIAERVEIKTEPVQVQPVQSTGPRVIANYDGEPVSTQKWEIERLKGPENWTSWRLDFVAVAKAQRIWTYLTYGIKEPDSSDSTKWGLWIKVSRMATALIMTTVDKSIKVLFTNTDDPRVMWAELQRKYDKVRGVDRIRLLGEVYTLQMKPGTPMRSHVDRALGLFQSLTNAGHAVTQMDKKAVLIRSLPQEYITTKTMLEHMSDYWTIDQFVATMLSQESVIKGTKNQPAANYAFEASRPRPASSNSFNPHRSQKGCYHCGNHHHKIKDCPQLLNERRGQAQNRYVNGQRPDNRHNRFSGRQQMSKSTQNHAHVTRNQAQEEKDCCEPHPQRSDRPFKFNFDPEFGASSNVLTLQNVTYAFATRISRGHACDSACTISCTGDKNLLVNFEGFAEDDYEPIMLGDNSVVYATGCGELRIPLTHGEIKLKKCFYVPAFTISLLSLGQCRDEGYKWSSFGEPDTIEFYDTYKKFLGSARRQVDGLYIVGGTENLAEGCSTSYSACRTQKLLTADVNLFHQRCGHFGVRTLRAMDGDKKYGIHLTGKVVDCVDCIKAKISQVPHPPHAIRSDRPLQRIYVDIQTDMPVGNLHRYRHALTIVDDASRFAICEPLVRKSDAPEAIKAFILQMERKLNTKVVAVLSDNGSEFIGNDLKDFYRQNGITQELTVRHSPQSSGVVERTQRCLKESATAMLLRSGLNTSNFWPWALMAAAHVRNRVICRATNATPFEKFYGVLPSLEHLRVWGCVAWSHIPKQDRGKFESKAEKLFFVGYVTNTKAWMFFNPANNKFVIRNDVRFLETVFKGSSDLEPNF